MAESALRSLVSGLMQGGPAPAGMADYRTSVQGAVQRPRNSADLLGGLSQFTSLDTPQNMSLGATAADIALGFAPGIGTAQGIRDFERARRDDNVLGMALGGLSAIPVAGGIVRAGKGIGRAVEGALDMSQAARMQRAADEGFDERVFYHGTGSDFEAFDPGQSRGARYNTGVFLTDNPDVASTYASGSNKQVMPLRVRMKNPINVHAEGANWNRLGPDVVVELPERYAMSADDQLLYALQGGDIPESMKSNAQTTTMRALFPETYDYEDDFMDTNDFARWAKTQGVDSVIFNDIVDRGPSGVFSNQNAMKPSRNIVMFEPSSIRSVNAAFDPAKRGSSNLMAGVAGTAVTGSALRSLVPQEQERRPD